MVQAIHNTGQLARSALREDALAMVQAGLRAIDTREAMRGKISLEGDSLIIEKNVYPLAGKRLYFVGIGKCAFAAAQAIEEILKERLEAGIALDVAPLDGPVSRKIETYVGTHPNPTDVNVRATERIVEFLDTCGKGNDALVLILISGGGSALLCLHDPPMTCLDESVLFNELTAHGASIEEMNTVRKHTSLARGGGLARAAYPADVVGLIISDVPGNDIQFIASGPTVMDTSTVADAHTVLSRYSVDVPEGVRFVETPKEGALFERVRNLLLLTNRDALQAMEQEAAKRGYNASIVTDHFRGDVHAVGEDVLRTMREVRGKRALLFGGESTVSLQTGSGKGGRNQELALSVLRDIGEGELVLPFASDGRDNTDHAGGIADSLTRDHASALSLSIEESLAQHASYSFFDKTGDALSIGATGSNVSDLLVALTS